MRPPARSARPSGIAVAVILLGLAGCGGETSPDGGGDSGADTPIAVDAAPGDSPIADAPATDAEPCWVPGGCQCCRLGQPCCAGAIIAACSQPTTACVKAPGALADA